MRYNLLEVLDNLHPEDTDYSEWLQIGMALKLEGYSLTDWDSWSARETGSRYRPGNCEKKWKSFTGNTYDGRKVTGGTIVDIAKKHGWQPDYWGALDWDAEIGYSGKSIVESSGLEDEKVVPMFPDWDPVKEIRTYLDAVFEEDDFIGYVTETWETEDGINKPTKGVWDRTKDQLLRALDKHPDDFGAVFGDYNAKAGAWIRFNPLDGKGCKNENVMAFRFALIESDKLPIERQLTLIRELELPAAAIVFSGGKSVHAIVHVDARDETEYRNRVNYLYGVCEKNGLTVDQQNKNPSRMSRMPGAERGDKHQYLIDVNAGRPSWNAWKEWIEEQNDDLPDFENLSEVWDEMPPLAPPLIEGVLRQGHKMLLAGPSKAGKSFALINLAISIAEGSEWMGMQCAKGRVLYINLELDRASCLHRFRDVYEARGMAPENLQNIEIWNLRGKSVPMDQLVRPLIRRAKSGDEPLLALILDPIYKVITGDENSASDMAAFTNQFDKICRDVQCSTIYCHHHSKGSQGKKRSADRASGSGVFARDPDALIDMIELFADDDMKASEKAVLGTDIDPDSLTAWRIEMTLREFPSRKPQDVWFSWPLHHPDAGKLLEDAEVSGEFWQNLRDPDKKEKRKQGRMDALEKAFGEIASFTGSSVCHISDIAEFMGVSVKTVRRRIKEHDSFEVTDNIVRRKEQISLEKLDIDQ